MEIGVYKVCYNTSRLNWFELCEPWWQSFIRKCAASHGNLNLNFNLYVEAILKQDDIAVDWKAKHLIFKSKEDFTMFILKRT
jgi:hypothetical protein